MCTILSQILHPLSRRLFCRKILLEHTEQIEFLQNQNCYDVAVIGGGIIGTAIAREIKIKSPSCKTILVEKEGVFGKHQSSHNSGVIHAGIHYKPNSLKAKLCVKGRDLITKYCDENNIPYKNCGKLIIATDPLEIPTLKQFYERGHENGLKELELVENMEDIRKIEPKCKGFLAIWSPKTGNVDWSRVTRSFGDDYRKNGGYVLFNNEVKTIKSSGDANYPVLIKCNDDLYLKSKYAVLCGGLHSSKLSELVEEKTGETNLRLSVSMRVNYQLLKNENISTNVYAVPDIDLPFLGVHLSPMLDGRVLLGPCAVPAYHVEGYSGNEIDLNYVRDVISSPAFLNNTKKYLLQGVEQVKQLQKLVQISEENVIPGPVAVQAQYLNEDGTFVEDFVIDFFKGEGINKRIIHCRFMPSPAATSSLAVADYVTEKLFEKEM